MGVVVETPGGELRVSVRTIPGRVENENAWFMLLKHVDGVVFVVDTQVERLAANVEASQRLDAMLAQLGCADMPPIVVQSGRVAKAREGLRRTPGVA
jgi:hypothetical protein